MTVHSRLPLLLSFLGVVAGCTAGRAGAPALDVPPEEAGRADALALGEDALLDRREALTEGAPYDAEEPAELVDEPTDFATIVLDEDPPAPLGYDVAAVGVGAWPPPTAEELAVMSEAGLELVRVFVPYRAEEDYGAPSAAYVAALDGLFADAARAEITLLPVLIATDGPPAITDDALTRFGDYAFWLADRYGEGGALWEEREELPYFPPPAWEVWSEPNHPAFWQGEIDADHYRTLLLYARAGLRDGDPTARVVVGGLAPSTTPGVTPPAAFLRAMLESPDADRLFDAVGLHPFAADADGALAELASVRRLLEEHGLGDAGVWITAAGWASPPGTEADAASELRVLLDQIALRRDEWRIGPLLWHGHRDLTLDETGGIDTWAGHTGLFAVESGRLLPRPALDVAVEPRTRPALPVLRDAPGRTGPIRTHLAQRRARRDGAARRGRRARTHRAFRRVVTARMYQLGTCVNRDGEMKPGCDPWTLPNADTWQTDRYPVLDERRAAYVCDALRRLRPRFVSGLVRLGSEEVLSTDPGVRAEVERQARVFRMVRGCVRRGRREPVHFDVVLNALHFTHDAFGIHTRRQGSERHEAVLRRMQELFRPDAWFYDFYSDPFLDGARTEETCYVQGTVCGVFHPEGMDPVYGFARRHRQWVGGNSFRGQGIPPRTDYIAVTTAGGMQGVTRDRDRARQGRPDLAILMHIRNDPQHGCSEGLAFMHRGDRFRRDVMRRHIRNQTRVGYSYMYPAFFPLRFVRHNPTPDPERCTNGLTNYAELGRVLAIEAYDGRDEGQLRWMRWHMDNRPARP